MHSSPIHSEENRLISHEIPATAVNRISKGASVLLKVALMDDPESIEKLRKSLRKGLAADGIRDVNNNTPLIC